MTRFKMGRYKKLFIPFLVLGGLVIFCSYWINARFSNIFSGISIGMKFFLGMFPPDFSVVSELLEPVVETVFMAFLGTIFGTILSIPFAVAAASNISPSWLRNLIRFLISVERAIPEVIILLFLVSATGLGLMPGVIALSIGAIGMIGKFLSDSIEEIDPISLDSLRSVGASRIQVIYYGVIPEVVPKIISYALFRFEYNVRLSVIMGAVGAGGIGYYIAYYFGLNYYGKALTALLLTTLLILLSERLSSFLRNRIKLEDLLQ